MLKAQSRQMRTGLLIDSSPLGGACQIWVSVPSLFGYGRAVQEHRSRRFRTAHVWQVVSALIVVCVGCLILGTKLSAQAQAAPLGAASGANSGAGPTSA